MLTLQKDTPATYTKDQLWGILAPGGTSSAWRIEPSRSSLPPGMTATSTQLSGTPTTAGSYTVVLGKDVGLGEYTYRTLPITVDGPPPTPTDPLVAALLAFLNASDDPEMIALAEAHLPIVTSMVKAYTRGNGFDTFGPKEDVKSVIITAAARLVVNPEQAIRVTIGDYSETKAVFNGFSLAELAVLNRYRRRSA